MSVAVHALLVGAFILLSIKEFPDERGMAEAHVDSAMQVALLTMSSKGTAGAGPRSSPPAAPSKPVRSPDPVAPPGLVSPPQSNASMAPTEPEAPAADPKRNSTPSTVVGAADPAVGDAYRRRLFDHIAGYRRPPLLTPGERADGTVMVRFSLDRGGEVLNVAVYASSGAPGLDAEAVATIWRARPMPPIPALLPGHLTVTLPVSFGAPSGSQPG